MSCVGDIEGKVGKVMAQYAATSNITVLQAFRDTLRPRRWGLLKRRNFAAS